MNQIRFILGLLITLTAPVSIASPKVVVTIAPLHSLVSSIMNGVASPELLINGNQSPHHFHLKPSAAKILQNADLIIWTGGALETSLVKPLQTLASKSKLISFFETPGITTLPFRESALLKTVAHQNHNSANDTRHSNAVDPHIWLDPINATWLVERVAKFLSEHDPANRKTYLSNAHATIAQLRQLTQQIQTRLDIQTPQPFLVLHDAFQYFEMRFNLKPAAAVMSGDATSPGASRVQSIMELVHDASVRCILKEPQLSDKLLHRLVERRDVAFVDVDPLGSKLKPGPGLYAQLLLNVTNSFYTCAGPENQG